MPSTRVGALIPRLPAGNNPVAPIVGRRMAMVPRLRELASVGLVLVGLVLASSLSAQQAGNKAAVKRMHQHLTTLDAVQYAVVRGVLDDVKSASQELSDQLSMDGLPPDGQKHLSDLKAAAIAGHQDRDPRGRRCADREDDGLVRGVPRGARQARQDRGTGQAGGPAVTQDPDDGARLRGQAAVGRSARPVRRGVEGGRRVDEEGEALDRDVEGRRAVEAGERRRNRVPQAGGQGR